VSAPVPALDVVVVAYGPPDALAAALAHLGGAYPVTVVDNSSSPATAAVAKKAGARYVDPGANVGFAAAVNMALERREDTGRHVLLLNPDARIEPGQVARLHGELVARPGLACVAPAQHAPGSGAPTRARWPWHTPAGAWAEAVGLARVRLRSRRYFVGGAVLLMRAEAIADVGRLDERFFLYSEDEDWERRATRRGWRLGYCPEVVAAHGGGGTEVDRGRLQLRLHAAIERYVRKWYGAGGWALYRAGTLTGLALRMAVRGGERRAASARLARLYLVGPDRAAVGAGALPPLAPSSSPQPPAGRA
jgi:GT2 family glycosyltransferase